MGAQDGWRPPFSDVSVQVLKAGPFRLQTINIVWKTAILCIQTAIILVNSMMGCGTNMLLSAEELAMVNGFPAHQLMPECVESASVKPVTHWSDLWLSTRCLQLISSVCISF